MAVVSADAISLTAGPNIQWDTHTLDGSGISPCNQWTFTFQAWTFPEIAGNL